MADTFIDDLDWVTDELITSTKFNQWWANMQNFHNGTALGDGIIVTRHLSFAKYRYVPVDNVEVLNTDPSNTTFNDLDLTSYTSANTYAVSLIASYTNAGTIRGLQMRANGSSATNQVLRASAPNVLCIGTVVMGVDSDQILEWSVTNADVTNVTLTLVGYWETY